MEEFENIDLSFDPAFSCINIRYDINSIIKKLITDSKINNTDDIKNILMNQHELVFKYDNLINTNRAYVQQLFTDGSVAITFLKTLDSIIGLISLDNEEVTFINKLVYDFFECANSIHYTKENEIKELLLSISYNINSSRINQLSNFIGINSANILSILSYSSFVDEKVVHRVNDFVITNISIDNINELTAIYNIIFNIIPVDGELERKGKNYILHSMLEYWDKDIEHDENQYKMFQTISMMIIYVFDLLEFIPLHELFKEYGNMIKLLNIDSNKVRFSLNKFISSDFNTVDEKLKQVRFKTIISDLENENIFIP